MAESDCTNCSSANTLHQDVRDLPTDMCVSFDLGQGYELSSTKELYYPAASPDQFDISSGRVYTLWKNKESVCQFSQEEGSLLDAVEGKKKYRELLAESIKQHLPAHEDPKLVKKILSEFVKDAPAVIPDEPPKAAAVSQTSKVTPEEKEGIILTRDKKSAWDFWVKYEGDENLYTTSEVKVHGVPKTKLDLVFSEAVFRIAKIFHPVSFNDRLYTYNSETGLYEQDDGGVNSWLQIFTDTPGDYLGIDAGKFSKHEPHGNLIKELYDALKRFKVFSHDSGSPFNRYHGVPVANGVVCFDDEYNPRLEPYTPEHMFRHKLKVAYNLSAPTARIIEILKMWVGCDNYEYLIQIAAQCIWQKIPGNSLCKKAYLLLGEKNTGKTTFLSELLVERIFGKKNTANLSLDKVTDRFNPADLEDAWMNAKDDMKHIKSQQFGDFKDFSGSRYHRVERKYQNPYIADTGVVHVFSANAAPELDQETDTDSAFWIRWIVLQFPNEFKRDLKWVSKNLTEENCEGFFLLTLQYLKRFQETGDLPREQPIEETMRLWKSAYDGLHKFLETETVRDPEGSIPKDELLSAIQKYKAELPSTSTYYQKLKQSFPRTLTGLTSRLQQCEGIEVRRLGSTDSRERKYSGIRWKENSRFNSSNKDD